MSNIEPLGSGALPPRSSAAPGPLTHRFFKKNKIRQSPYRSTLAYSASGSRMPGRGSHFQEKSDRKGPSAAILRGREQELFPHAGADTHPKK